MTILEELNFRVFEVVRTFGDKGLEIYVPDLKRTIDLSIDEVLILDLEKELRKAWNEQPERLHLLRNYVERTCMKDNEYMICSVDVFKYAKKH
jgi:hypothetical protein